MKKSYMPISENRGIACTEDVYKKIKNKIKHANVTKDTQLYYIKLDCSDFNSTVAVYRNQKQITQEEACEMCVHRLRKKIKNNCPLNFQLFDEFNEFKNENNEEKINDKYIEKQKELVGLSTHEKKEINALEKRENLGYLIKEMEKKKIKKNEQLYHVYSEFYEEEIDTKTFIFLLLTLGPFILIGASICIFSALPQLIKEKIKKLKNKVKEKSNE